MLRQSTLVIIFMVTLFTFVISMTACAPFKPNSSKAGMCNELNSSMIFSSGTSNIQKAEMQSAQQGLVQRTYDKKCGG